MRWRRAVALRAANDAARSSAANASGTGSPALRQRPGASGPSLCASTPSIDALSMSAPTARQSGVESATSLSNTCQKRASVRLDLFATVVGGTCMTEGGLRVNSPHVIHETIDGEVIVINLASGNYYSVKGAGADVWDVIESSPGADESSIAATIAARFGRASDDIEREIADFLGALQREELVAAAENGATPLMPSANGAGNGSKTF